MTSRRAKAEAALFAEKEISRGVSFDEPTSSTSFADFSRTETIPKISADAFRRTSAMTISQDVPLQRTKSGGRHHTHSGGAYAVGSYGGGGTDSQDSIMFRRCGTGSDPENSSDDGEPKRFGRQDTGSTGFGIKAVGMARQWTKKARSRAKTAPAPTEEIDELADENEELREEIEDLREQKALWKQTTEDLEALQEKLATQEAEVAKARRSQALAGVAEDEEDDLLVTRAQSWGQVESLSKKLEIAEQGLADTAAALQAEEDAKEQLQEEANKLEAACEQANNEIRRLKTDLTVSEKQSTARQAEVKQLKDELDQLDFRATQERQLRAQEHAEMLEIREELDMVKAQKHSAATPTGDAPIQRKKRGKCITFNLASQLDAPDSDAEEDSGDAEDEPDESILRALDELDDNIGGASQDELPSSVEDLQRLVGVLRKELTSVRAASEKKMRDDAELRQDVLDLKTDVSVQRRRAEQYESENAALQQRTEQKETENVALQQRAEQKESENVALQQRSEEKEERNVALQQRVQELEKQAAMSEVSKVPAAMLERVKETKAGDQVNRENVENEQLKNQLSQAYESYALAAGEVMRLKDDLAAAQTKGDSTKADDVYERLKEVQLALRSTLIEESPADSVKDVQPPVKTVSDPNLSAGRDDSTPLVQRKPRKKAVTFAESQFNDLAAEACQSANKKGGKEDKAQSKRCDATAELRKECDDLRRRLASAERLREQALGDAGQLDHELRLLKAERDADSQVEPGDTQELQRALETKALEIKELEAALTLENKAAQEWKARAYMPFWYKIGCNMCLTSRSVQSDTPITLEQPALTSDRV